MKLKIDLPWDKYSDQPHIISDKATKKSIYKKYRIDTLKLLALNIAIFPVLLLSYIIRKHQKQQIDTNQFFGMGVNPSKNISQSQIKALINELGAKHLYIRIPLHDIENLETYIKFIQDLNNFTITVNILQDRRHVENSKLLENSLNKIFTACEGLTKRFQIGHAINRKKWAFFSTSEFLKFYECAYQLKKKKYPHITLIGSSVIDFEYYFTIPSLFNRKRVVYDEFNSLLYVDRRGAPESSQTLGLRFSLDGKIKLLQSLLRLSKKAPNSFIISEANWPIKDKGKHSPTGEDYCVSLEDYSKYMVRYYLIALNTQIVSQVFWHQLVAPGYGLIDNRDKTLVKYPAFEAYKILLSHIQGAKLKHTRIKNQNYTFVFETAEKEIHLCWSLTQKTITNRADIAYDIYGKLISASEIKLTDSPIYLIYENKNSR